MRVLVALACALLLSGCAAMFDRAAADFAQDLESAIRAYDEPSVIREGLPAYLLLLEARLESRPNDSNLRLTTARMTASYATLFGDENGTGNQAMHSRLSERALAHARLGACNHANRLCDLHQLDFDALRERQQVLKSADLEAVYVLATTWTTWIDAHSDDFSALADLPRVESLLEWVAEQDPSHDDGAVWLYLAVLNSQRPPAAGGRPELAREYFARARQESEGENLLINVFMADSYARLVFDRELWVSLLVEVLESRTDASQYRLANQIARARAERMLQQTEEIFD